MLQGLALSHVQAAYLRHRRLASAREVTLRLDRLAASSADDAVHRSGAVAWNQWLAYAAEHQQENPEWQQAFERSLLASSRLTDSSERAERSGYAHYCAVVRAEKCRDLAQARSNADAVCGMALAFPASDHLAHIASESLLSIGRLSKLQGDEATLRWAAQQAERHASLGAWQASAPLSAQNRDRFRGVAATIASNS